MQSGKSEHLAFYSSPIGKKIITGVTGLGLVAFVLLHMTGNLLLFASADAYNQYAHFLLSLGPLLYFVELVLLVSFVFHATLGIQMYFGNRQARPIGYTDYATAGWPSLQSMSSRTMILSGLVLLGFLIIHLLSFKYGTYYYTTIDGVEMRDLARLVVEKFQHPIYTFGYVVVMLLLGFHLRHGIWSGLQSLGAMSPQFTPVIYGFGLILAVLIAVGFLVLPVAIFFGLV
ncbi:MAG: succinate dehydrogenase cytochrome b subunit [Cyanothece sp. SIO1E1]|nr:succinate dehydrogenase cytochrome b subunit [Cyanothece sp. SIO1E1]